MTIGLPFNLAFMSSNVTDPVPTIEDLLITCQAPIFSDGLEVRDGEWIYEYHGVEFTPKTWNRQDEIAGVYQLDEIILKGCDLIKVTGKKGTGITEHRRPKEPEYYSNHDISMKWQDWDRRYVKLPRETLGAWLAKMYCDKNKKYMMLWSASGDTYAWYIADTRGGSQRWNIPWTGKYDSSNDKKAQKISWGAPGKSRTPAIKVTSMVVRKGYFFLRTWVDAPIEYATYTVNDPIVYMYGDVGSPADIDGFRPKRQAQAYNPFDGKNYTKTEFDTVETEGFARWDVVATEDIDSVALGHVICDTVNFRVSNEDGDALFELNNYPIDNTLAKNSTETYEDTVVLYTDKTYPAGSVITFWLYAAVVTVGELIGASRLDSGFTKLNFKNSFKDFSPKEQDQWGNWYYRDGVRVHVHSGSVEYPVVSYDQLNRLMILIGGQKVVINSSDSTENEVPDGRKVFAATMLIARFTKFDLATTEKNKRIGETATYSFSVEELV